jgi:hypothetical protein
MSEDYFRQNPGPHQGNIHDASNQGKNPETKAGSTTEKINEVKSIPLSSDQKSEKNKQDVEDSSETWGIP